MIRKFNYTRRQKIFRKDARIIIRDYTKDHAYFDADLILHDYLLPSSSLVFVEAYRQTTWMRFPFGTVGNYQPPSDRYLTEFDTIDGILFRVRITSAEEPIGRLLAEADGIPFKKPEEEEEEKEPLLPVIPENIGDQIYRLDFSDSPQLLINSSINNCKSFIRTPIFISAILPSILREILTRIILIEKHFDYEDETDWKSKWLKFSLLLPGVREIPDERQEERIKEEWIEEAVASFCRKHKMLNHFEKFWASEESQ